MVLLSGDVNGPYLRNERILVQGMQVLPWVLRNEVNQAQSYYFYYSSHSVMMKKSSSSATLGLGMQVHLYIRYCLLTTKLKAKLCVILASKVVTYAF